MRHHSHYARDMRRSHQVSFKSFLTNKPTECRVSGQHAGYNTRGSSRALSLLVLASPRIAFVVVVVATPTVLVHTKT